jgi:hypothetical protein
MNIGEEQEPVELPLPVPPAKAPRTDPEPAPSMPPAERPEVPA